MRGYAVTTLGGLASEPWPDIPPGWVPAGTPGLRGMPAPVPGPPAVTPEKPSVSAPMVAAVAFGGVVVGAIGLLVWERWR